MGFLLGLVVGLLAGLAGGWYAKSKYGAKAQAVESALK